MIPVHELLLRLAVAAVLGGLVGFDRERAETTAGLRTHAIVALGAALFMIVSMFGFANAVHPPAVVLDPSRVAAQVVSGIGFLGAGVIVFRKDFVRGLTTAASVWLVAAIGMAVGGGLYIVALGTTAFAYAILAVVKPLERKLVAGRRPQLVALVIDRRDCSLRQLKEALRAAGASVERIDVRYGEDPATNDVDVVLKDTTSESIIGTIERLSTQHGVREVRSVLDS